MKSLGLCILKTIHQHFSLQLEEAMCISILCEHTNSHGTRDFASNSDLQVPFLNAVAYGGIAYTATCSL